MLDIRDTLLVKIGRLLLLGTMSIEWKRSVVHVMHEIIGSLVLNAYALCETMSRHHNVFSTEQISAIMELFLEKDPIICQPNGRGKSIIV